MPKTSSITVIIGNSLLAPLSPNIPLTFQIHLNVKLCVSRAGGIKYIFKCVRRDSDSIRIKTVCNEGRYGEFGHFQYARYVSTSKALWQISQFEIVYNQATVTRLDAYLKNHQTAYFREELQRQVANRPRLSIKITERFAANRNCIGFSHLEHADYSS